MKYLYSLIFLIYSSIAGSLHGKPTIKDICDSVTFEIRDLELQKINLKKEFKNIKSEQDQMALITELTKDVNATLKQQTSQAKIYHYLECSRFE